MSWYVTTPHTLTHLLTIQNAVPAWGSYLYQNFLLPAFSPSEWLNNNTPNGGLNLNPTDYFGNQPNSSASTSSSTYLASIMPSRSTTSSSSQPYSAQAGPSSSSFYPQQYYNAPSAIPTSLLHTHSSSSTISPSVEVIENLIRSPSPISYEITPLPSPKRGAKRRASSMDSVEADSHDEAELHEEHDIAEGVERDGMIWGMRVEDYRALSARERKRVRNRISARTFRAKRKGELLYQGYFILVLMV